MKNLWHGIKSIISKNSSFSSIDKITDKNGNLTSNPFEISSVFNVFLSLYPTKLLELYQKLMNHRLNIFISEIPIQYFFQLKSIVRL